LAAAIDAGEWKDGDRLPAESQLEREHGLARGTVRSAINLLRERGLAYTIQARGTFAAGRPRLSSGVDSFQPAFRAISRSSDARRPRLDRGRRGTAQPGTNSP
jgi:DNA-binding GntR family transcriptional regulator